MKPALTLAGRATRRALVKIGEPLRRTHSIGSTRLTVDAPTRVFHWLFAISLLGAYLTGDSEWWRSIHIAFGYMMLALIAFRLGYGLMGPRHVRLSALVRRASGWSEWLQALRPGQHTNGPPAPQLQHLFTASVVLLLMGWIVPVFVTGYAALNEWDAFLGGEIFEALHEFFANGFLVLIALHLMGLLLFSLFRRRNLAAPMLTGRSPGNGPSLVQHNRVWLAWLLAAGVLGFGAWEWAHAASIQNRAGGVGACRHAGMIRQSPSRLQQPHDQTASPVAATHHSLFDARLPGAAIFTAASARNAPLGSSFRRALPAEVQPPGAVFAPDAQCPHSGKHRSPAAVQAHERAGPALPA